MLTKQITFKYNTPYMGPFMITQCWTNGTISLQCVAIDIRQNIRCINPHKSDTKVEDYNSINMYDAVNI